MKKLYPLSKNGLLISLEKSNINFICLHDIKNIDDICFIHDVGYGNFQFFSGRNENFSIDVENISFNRSINNNIFSINFLSEKIISLETSNGFLSSVPGVKNFISEECSDNEMFRLIDKEELEKLSIISNCEVIINNNSPLIAKNITNKHIEFEGFSIDLDSFFSGFIKNSMQFVFFEKNFPHLATIINPLFVYVVFGINDIIKQFIISLHSLYNFGKYRGEITIITNLNEIIINTICSKYNFKKINIINYFAKDNLDYVGARINFLSSRDNLYYRPIFYLDTDVLIIKDISEIIHVCAKNEKISAQIESDSKFKHKNSVGGTLFKESPFNIDDVNGFNAGVIMVPCHDKFKNIFNISHIMMKKYTQKNGRDSIPFYDQSVLNYVIYKFNCFDESPMTKFVRNSWEGENKNALFVHFWPNKEKRTQDMAFYITSRSAEYKSMSNNLSYIDTLS
ncbi:glycosyltransferase family protein [Gluconobacter kondonii]|uniref:glycosyltransferase n=1 Tax=Gluconobacter kondonii TaxID=941463 RepID=UPI001981F97E|nr:glycosyltransferase [Gluconobacter kondonii]MBN3868666.1 hypothetical protein [Gluconobacter kondonii]